MTSSKRLLIASSGALAAGVANGLLGAGGGIILVFALTRSFFGITQNQSPVYTSRDVMATSMSVMLPISAVSAFRYALKGAVDSSLALSIALPAVLGGILGGFLLCKLKEKFITKLFAFLVIYSGITMIAR